MGRKKGLSGVNCQSSLLGNKKNKMEESKWIFLWQCGVSELIPAVQINWQLDAFAWRDWPLGRPRELPGKTETHLKRCLRNAEFAFLFYNNPQHFQQQHFCTPLRVLLLRTLSPAMIVPGATSDLTVLNLSGSLSMACSHEEVLHFKKGKYSAAVCRIATTKTRRWDKKEAVQKEEKTGK